MNKSYCDNCDKKVDYFVKEETINQYKGYEVNVVERIGVCKSCKSDIYIPELESQNFKNLYDKYRELAGLISIDEIIGLRSKYNISQRELTAILNWGKMTINRYENGAPPSQSHSDYLSLLLSNPKIFEEKTKEAFESGRIKKGTFNKVIEGIDAQEENNLRDKIIESLSHNEDEFNGFRSFDIERLNNLIGYLSDKARIYKTSLNKYLWYIDFLNFKENLMSITGLRYEKYTYGPIIEKYKYEDILKSFNDKFSKIEIEDGDCIKTTILSKSNYDMSIFKEEEREVIDKVINLFKTKNSNEITELSHKEKAWLEKEDKELISYEYARFLKVNFD